MNSSEQKDFEHYTPTTDEVDETVGMLQHKFETHENQQDTDAREACQEVIRILTARKTQYTDISQALKSDAAKAAAVLAVDYLNGDCSRDALLVRTTHLL